MTVLNDRFYEALRNPNVGFELDYNILGDQALIHVTIPGKTERSKRLRPLPVIVGDEGQTHADLLRRLADALEHATAPDLPGGAS